MGNYLQDLMQDFAVSGWDPMAVMIELFHVHILLLPHPMLLLLLLCLAWVQACRRHIFLLLSDLFGVTLLAVPVFFVLLWASSRWRLPHAAPARGRGICCTPADRGGLLHSMRSRKSAGPAHGASTEGTWSLIGLNQTA